MAVEWRPERELRPAGPPHTIEVPKGLIGTSLHQRQPRADPGAELSWEPRRQVRRRCGAAGLGMRDRGPLLAEPRGRQPKQVRPEQWPGRFEQPQNDVWLSRRRPGYPRLQGVA